MNKNLIIIASVVLFMLTGLLLLSPLIRPSSPPSDRLIVGATIFPLVDIIEHIAGPHAQVVQLIPSNSSPHSFSLTPQQLSQITHAKAIFAIGHGLDNHVITSIENINPYPIIIVDRNISLRPFGSHEEGSNENEDSDNHEDSEYDPHYWLTVPNAQIIAATVASELIKLDPANTAAYSANLDQYTTSLDTLEKTLQEQFDATPQLNFMAVHDAWSYLADHYGLSLIATYEPIEGRTPTINDLRHFQQLIAQYNIKTFFTEPQKTTSSGTRLMESEFGLKIKTLDPIGGIEDNDSYEAIMLRNMQALTTTN